MCLKRKVVYMTDIRVDFAGESLVIPVTLMLPASGVATDFQVEVQAYLSRNVVFLIDRAAEAALGYLGKTSGIEGLDMSVLVPRNVIVWRKREWGVLFDVKGEIENQVAAVFVDDTVYAGPHDILL